MKKGKVMEKEFKKYIEDLKIIGNNKKMDLIISDYHCIIKRNRLNFLCGYVVLDSNIKIELDVLNSLEVHGGITYMEYETIDSKEKLVIGFDCGHCCDYIPVSELNFNENAIYKNVDFVKKELKKIIDQIDELLENKK